MAAENPHEFNHINFPIGAHVGGSIHVVIDELSGIITHGPAQQPQLVSQFGITKQAIDKCAKAQKALPVLIELLKSSEGYSDGHHLICDLILSERIPDADVACGKPK